MVRKSGLLLIVVALAVAVSGMARAQSVTPAATAVPATPAVEKSVVKEIWGKVLVIDKDKGVIQIEATDGKKALHPAENAAIAELKVGEWVRCDLAADGTKVIRCEVEKYKGEPMKE